MREVDIVYRQANQWREAMSERWTAANLDSQDAVFAVTRATSRWTYSPDTGEEYRTSLDDVGDARILQLSRPDRTGRLVPHIECPVVTIGLVKAHGRYHVVVDGVAASPGDMTLETASVGGAVTTRVDVHTHRGMYIDTASQSRIFSPCAVFVLLEDGERPPERVVVSVMQQFASLSLNSGFGEKRSIGEIDLEVTRAQDVKFNVALTPYPVPTPRPPVVVIYDMSKVYRQQAQESSGLFWTSVESLWSVIVEMQDVTFTPGALTNLINWGTSLFGGTPSLPTDGSTLWWQAFGERLGPSAILSFAAMLAIFWQIPLLTSTASALVASAGSADFFTLYVQNDVKGMFESIAKPILSSVWSWASSPPPAEPIKVKFTIEDITSTMRSLMALTAMSEEEIKRVVEDNSMRKERTFWAWLLQAEDRTWPERIFRGGAKRGGRLAGVVSGSNPLDMDAFHAGQGSCINTSIQVSIDDSEVFSSGGAPVTYDFVCGLPDTDERGELGAISAGLIQQLEELQQTIVDFRQHLDDMVNRPLDEQTQPTYVNFYIKPLFRLVGFFRESKREEQTRAAVEIVYQTNIRLARKHIQAKLERHFVNVGSRGDTMRVSLGELLQRFVPTATRSQTRDPPPYAVRELPHVSLSPRLLFPSAIDTGIGSVDVDTATAVVREETAFGDAIKAYNRAISSARLSVKKQLVVWQLQNVRPRLVLAYTRQSVNRIGFFRSATVPPSSYDLVYQPPADVRVESVNRPTSERYHKKLLMIAKSSSRARKDGHDLYEALGIGNSDWHAAALQTLAEVMVDEMIATSVREVSAGLFDLVAFTEALKPVHLRAAERAEAVASLLKASVEAGPGSAIYSDDPGLRCTLHGLDTARTIKRMRLDALRGLAGKNAILSFASILSQVAKAVSSDAKRALVIPSEPLSSVQSMQMCWGTAAYERAARLLGSDGGVTAGQTTRALQAIKASYPVLLIQQLPAVKRQQLAVPIDKLTEAAPRYNGLSRDLVVRSLRVRMARLCCDFDFLTMMDPAASSSMDESTPVDDVAKLLFESGENGKTQTYYVPFGYGDPMPPLAFPPSPACMFASVPVWFVPLREALTQISELLSATGTAALSDTGSLVVQPSFASCAAAPQPEQPIFFLDDHVRRLLNLPPNPPRKKDEGEEGEEEEEEEEEEQSSDDDDPDGNADDPDGSDDAAADDDDPLAFRRPPEMLVFKPGDHATSGEAHRVTFFASCADSATATIGGTPTVSDVADNVSTMVWNAERMLQVHCLATSLDTRGVSLSIPTVNGVPPNPGVGTAQAFSARDAYLVNAYEEAILRYANLHYQVFRGQLLLLVQLLPSVTQELVDDEDRFEAEIYALGALVGSDGGEEDEEDAGDASDMLARLTIRGEDAVQDDLGVDAVGVSSEDIAELNTRRREEERARKKEEAAIQADIAKGDADRKRVMQNETLAAFAKASGWTFKDELAVAKQWFEITEDYQNTVYLGIVRKDWRSFGKKLPEPYWKDMTEDKRREVFENVAFPRLQIAMEKDWRWLLRNPDDDPPADLEPREAAEETTARYFPDRSSGRKKLNRADVEHLRVKGDKGFFSLAELLGVGTRCIVQANKIRAFYSYGKQNSSRLTPAWNEHARLSFLLAAALGNAMTSIVTSGQAAELIAIDATPPWKPAELSNASDALKRCIESIDNLDLTPTASMRLGEAAACLFEIALR